MNTGASRSDRLRDHRDRASYWPRATLLQMMKLVVLAAVASLAAAPCLRLAAAGVLEWPLVLMGEAVGIPLALAVGALVILRSGPGKDRAVRVLLLLSTVAALGVTVPPLFGPSPVWGAGGATRGMLMAMCLVLLIPTVILVNSLRKSP